MLITLDLDTPRHKRYYRHALKLINAQVLLEKKSTSGKGLHVIMEVDQEGMRKLIERARKRRWKAYRYAEQYEIVKRGREDDVFRVLCGDDIFRVIYDIKRRGFLPEQVLFTRWWWVASKSA
jgi:hypothetical protein